MIDIVEQYVQKSKKCKCKSWARCDYMSGFRSEHHSGCDKFTYLAELHILSRKISQLEAENKTLSEQVVELEKATEGYRYRGVEERLRKEIESLKTQLKEVVEVINYIWNYDSNSPSNE